MAARNATRLTRDELISALQRMVKVRRHEGIAIRDFCESLGISDRQVYREFGSWRKLREAANLKTPRAPIHEQFSNQELIREYQRVVHELGRLPSELEFNRKAKCCYATLKKRFGGVAGIRRVLQITEDADASDREDAGKPSLFRPSEHSPKRVPIGPDYLRQEWANVRIAFAVTSSEYRGQDSLDFDILFCLQHNWPPCPCKVIELQEVWRHPCDRKPEERTSPAEQEGHIRPAPPNGDGVS